MDEISINNEIRKLMQSSTLSFEGINQGNRTIQTVLYSLRDILPLNSQGYKGLNRF